MHRSAVRIAFLLLALPAGSTSGQAPPWKLFRSPTGIVAHYPATWVRFGISPDQLTLRSSPGGQEGVIIKPGQAFLWVGEPRDAPTHSMEGMMAYFTKDVDSVTTRRDLSVDPAAGGCEHLAEVVSWEPIIPREDATIRPPDMVNTEYFCEVGPRIVVIGVLNYADDRRTPEYQAVGLRIARSVRIVPPKSDSR